MAGDPVPNVELRLVAKSRDVAATVRADANGNFKFPVLPKGTYRVSPTDWQLWGNAIEITGTNASTCRRVSVYVALDSCQGGVHKRKPS